MALPISPQAQIALVKQFANSRIINAGMAASLTWVVYDFLLTFSREIKYIWLSKLSLPKITYLFLRVYTMAFIASNLYIRDRVGYSNKLYAYHWWGIMGVPVVTNVTTNVLLCMRLYALYRRSVKVLAFLLFVFLGSLTAELYVCVAYAVNSAKGPGTVLPPPIPGCIPASIPEGFSAIIAWVPTVAAQGIFFLMSVLHILQEGSESASPKHKAAAGWKALFQSRKRTMPLVVLFVRDGAVFFLIILLSLIMGLVIMIHDTALTSMAISFVIASYGFAGTRLILTLRESASKGLIGGDIATWEETFELRQTEVDSNLDHGMVFASVGSTTMQDVEASQSKPKGDHTTIEK
ncbi:hypothetical protein LshimejAT787_0207670 [Lyophyllum shimeji]|uniref:DUF6533 domain-containing protein n=1 Tax=Lyophyllum shimeji TaxID=47721 RepID=A0A9P3UJ84_LYOSH|nr:hypothetical protein LshimejAT787_0207670 [Lyophyllum shimeji]